jgi:hypothetical protein
MAIAMKNVKLNVENVSKTSEKKSQNLEKPE